MADRCLSGLTSQTHVVAYYRSDMISDGNPPPPPAPPVQEIQLPYPMQFENQNSMRDIEEGCYTEKITPFL